MIVKRRRAGFTLVELSLSIAFIGVLSIIVVVVVVNAISAYRRGITLNVLNTVGMDLVDDIRTTLRSSPGLKVDELCGGDGVCSGDGAYGYVYDVAEDAGGKIVGGVMCTGSYSYLWNSGEALRNDNAKLTLMYKVSSASEPKTESGFRLLKVMDANRMVCKQTNQDGDNYVSGNKIRNYAIDISSGKEIGEAPVELLSDDANGMVVYGLSVSRPTVGGLATSTFYDVSFTLGTLQGGVINSNSCAAPESGSADENFDYCAINKFNFAVQAIGSNI